MALLVLIILGVTLGWFSSILSRTESVGAIARQIGVGVAGALVGGVLLNSGSVLGGLSLMGLGAATASAIAALALYFALFTAKQSDQTDVEV